MGKKKWLKDHTTRLDGENIAVTGSTGGLGVHLCAYLASLGANLILLDRNEKRSHEHRERLLSQNPNITVECIPLDLEDLFSARAAAERLCELGVDVFIHNAGAYAIPRHACQSSYDNVFQINFATPYYMINKLLPHLRERGGKVVIVGSIAHDYSHIDENDVDFRTRTAASRVYGNAKRYLMFGLHELFKGEKDVSLSVVHPGITFTNITAHYPKLIFAVIKHPMKVVFMRPKSAALSILAGVFEKTEYCRWIGPRFFDIWGLPKNRLLKTCDERERERIAELSCEVLLRCEKSLLQDSED